MFISKAGHVSAGVTQASGLSISDSQWQEADMRLQSDIDALAAIGEDAKAMLKRIGLLDDAHKLDVVIVLRQIIDLTTYMESADRFIETPIIG
jgi:hypothetical protein